MLALASLITSVAQAEVASAAQEVMQDQLLLPNKINPYVGRRLPAQHKRGGDTTTNRLFVPMIQDRNLRIAQPAGYDQPYHEAPHLVQQGPEFMLEAF